MSIKTIEVRATYKDLEDNRHCITAMMKTIQRMKKAGIPLIGKLSVRAVTHGVLTISNEEHEMTGLQEVVYSWTGEAAEAEEDLI